ncbi:hypothetical protein K378_03391 [Streptomyces sp. Amel2xB2]|uniref:ATP-binding protein n=1 Tax=Streptomyces sp. Amel2xB2 TaxID=1305829 RepID=UPI000DBFD9C3|nr:ATP-binding protein [Streptomyces sp. Amel2xB2]RAJ63280.1 hypothetical protein K378_03391 [Streptomyces sp. Amel2xB2]
MVQHGSTRHGSGDGAGRDGTGGIGGAGGTGAGEPEARRPVRIVVGRQLLTVNPVDGSEMEPCPPAELPGVPRKLTLRERAVYARHSAEADETGTSSSSASGTASADAPAASSSVSSASSSADEDSPAAPAASASFTSGPASPGTRAIPVLERDAERDRLAGELSRGRSVRVTGLPGSGRTTLLDAVAAQVADLAPDGVIRLSGYRRTATDLLQELFASVHEASRHRPGEQEMREALRAVGAVVVIDDLAVGGDALGQLLDATPECAYLLAATPDVPLPSGDVHVEEYRLTGLSRTACLELLEHTVRRPLTDEEADAAQDMWFASEESSGGLPLRFVQAGALLRYGGRAGELNGRRSSAMSARVAERLSSVARDTLRFALALGGELPHRTHLPALIGDPVADEAEGELVRAGLITSAAGHYRLADGAAEALTDAGFADGKDARALMTAHHYAWWVDRPSAPPARVAVEADAVLAAVHGAQGGGHVSAAVLLARAAAPVFAASQRWTVWEKVLRAGLEAARTSGEVAQEAYFHHELGVLALCNGQLQRGVAELEASIAMRGALADQQGTFAGRRALALAHDLLAAQRPGAVPHAPEAPGVPETGVPEPGAAVPAAAAYDGAGQGAYGEYGQYGAYAEYGTGAHGEHAEHGVPAGQGEFGEFAETQQVSYEPADLATRSLAATLRGHRRGEARDPEAEKARTVAASIAGPRGDGVARPGDVNPTLVHPANRSVAYGARRNLAAAGAGAVLIAVLATIIGLGRMPDDGTGPLDRGTPGTTSQRDDRNELNADDPDSRSPRTGESSKSGTPSESSKSPDASDSASEDSPSASSSAPDDDPSSSEPGDAGGSGGGSPTGSPGTNGGTDGGGSNDGGTDDGGTDDGGTDDGGTDDGGTDDGGTDDGGTDDGGTDNGGTDDGGTDDGGTDTGGTGTGGTTGGTNSTGGTTGGTSSTGGSSTGGSTSGGSKGGATSGTVLGAAGLDAPSGSAAPFTA